MYRVYESFLFPFPGIRFMVGLSYPIICIMSATLLINFSFVREMVTPFDFVYEPSAQSKPSTKPSKKSTDLLSTSMCLS